MSGKANGAHGGVVGAAAQGRPVDLVDAVTGVLTAVCVAFGAHHGWIEDDRLLMLYRAQRAAERAAEATPAELRAYLPGAPQLPPSAVPPLLVPADYDRRRVPNGVWWVNYWGPDHLATLGEARVRGAGWARIVDAGGAALSLVATTEPLDVLRPDHATQVGALVGQLGLRKAQERGRF